MRPELSPALYFRRNFLRVLPSACVIVVAVALVASIVTIVRSVDLTVFTLYGYNRYVTGLTPRNALAIPEEELQKIRKLQNLGFLSPAHSYQTRVRTIFGKMFFPIFGLEPPAQELVMQRCGLRIHTGRMAREGEPEAVLSEEVARNLGVRLGDILLEPHSEDSYAPVPIRLVGLLRGPVWFGMTSKRLVDKNSPLTFVGYLAFARTAGPGDRERLDEAIERATDRGRVRVWRFAGLVRETRSSLSNLYLILNLVVGIIVAAITFVCGLLANIYFTQRLPEIAMLTAIGYSRAGLLRRAVGETALLCLFGWLVGVGAAVGLLCTVYAALLAPRGLLLDPVDLRSLLFTLPLPISITLFAVGTIWFRLSHLDPVAIIERRG